MKKKLVIAIMVLILAIGAVGGTLAWLTAQTDTVTNTFTTSGIDIELSESTGDSYQMVPGYTISKDPTVKVVKDSEKCYLFVKVEKSSNFDTFMKYEMAEGWIALDEAAGVYYRVVDSSNADQTFAVLKGNQVTVNDTVTKDQMDALNAEGATLPTLEFTAYASQYYKNNTGTTDADKAFSETEAWIKARPSTN